uniref:Glycosyl hydrolase family 3 protein n=1 Tax=Firmicutes bacterium enrichment culture clone fosmid MGS-M2 TaxID=1549349 RepID=A0A0B5KH13_9FIRM|nr:glycosyl hydrolase family 3 protein [Firmicutes bacterium enrichment culture clone fosmid MGS-M2]
MKKIPLEEKIKLTSGQSNWHFFDGDYIDGKKIVVADGPHGVRVYKQSVNDGDFLDQQHLAPTTLFPSASAMASTWNVELIKEAGKTIGKECRHHEVDVLLGPGMNLKRSPLGGRNFEYYSEDPYLTSEMGKAFVDGVQSEGVGACIKHFGLNEQETMRRFVDVKIDERTMHEMYLYPFYKVIKESNPWMIMSSYNKLNGHYASESSYLLKDVLRKQWSYEGAVVSDWGAVQDKVKSIKNGMNVEMPGPSSFEEDIKKALEQNELTEQEIDESLQPLFDLHQKVKQIKPLETLHLEEHHHVAQRVARESIVLLENDGILPLNVDNKKIGVIGQFAKEPRINGGGSATVKPYKQEIPYDALKATFDHIMYAEGYEENNTNKDLLKDVAQVSKESDVILYFTGTTDTLETEGKDRPHMSLPKGHIEVFEEIVKHNKNMIVILSNGSALDLRTIKRQSRAILETWFLGGAAAQAIVDILIGTVSPSGRLQETFPLMLEHTPHYGTFPQKETVDYHQDLIMNGYRYYDTHHLDVLYPFGYGLSYADIGYKDVSYQVSNTFENQYVQVTLTLENKSNIDAFETVQIYVQSNDAEIVKPLQELKAFKKVMVKAKEINTITIDVPFDAFESYSERIHKFVVYNGSYTLHVGQNSRDIFSSKDIQVVDGIDYRPVMDLTYPVDYLVLYYPKWAKFIEDNFRKLWWHEKEEPIWRIIDRYKRHKNISEEEIASLIKQIKEDINV